MYNWSWPFIPHEPAWVLSQDCVLKFNLAKTINKVARYPCSYLYNYFQSKKKRIHCSVQCLNPAWDCSHLEKKMRSRNIMVFFNIRVITLSSVSMALKVSWTIIKNCCVSCESHIINRNVKHLSGLLAGRKYTYDRRSPIGDKKNLIKGAIIAEDVAVHLL